MYQMQIITGTKCNPVTDIIDVVPMKITKKTFSKPLKSQKHKVITYFACNNGNYYNLLHLLHTLVDKFCYLGDMLSVDGDADAAVEARI